MNSNLNNRLIPIQHNSKEKLMDYRLGFISYRFLQNSSWDELNYIISLRLQLSTYYSKRIQISKYTICYKNTIQMNQIRLSFNGDLI